MSEPSPTLSDSGLRPAPTGAQTEPPTLPHAGAAPTLEAPPANFKVPGYELLGVLGKGGMGVVYQARQTALHRVVALKMILHADHAGAAERQRFRAEAEAVARLQHPHIVQIYEVGELGGNPFFSLEFCPGGGLDKKLAGNPLPPSEAAALVELLARAMHAAHRAGVVHRDLKPANVLLAADGSPKISDFGLAKKLDEAGQTASGSVLGTPSYMSPEQAGGRGKEVGPAADVYSLGAILYDCLTGRPPFRAASALDTLMQVVSEEPASPRRLNPRLPRDLEIICLKCLRKEPGKRYATAEALADDLRRFQAGEPIAARPAGALERAVKWARRRPAVAALLAAALLLAAAGAAGVAWAYREALRERDDALEANRQRLRARLDQLLTAAPDAVPTILADLEAERAAVLPRLRELWDGEPEPQRRMRAGLALLPAEPDGVKGPLADWMLQADDPREVLLARDALKPFRHELKAGLWRRLDDPAASAETRLRAMAALAAFDPDEPRWGAVAPAAAERLLAANPLRLGAWMQALEPVKEELLGPLAREFRSEGRPERRLAAATVLASYAADNPGLLANLLADGDDEQFAVLFPALRQHGERKAARLLEVAIPTSHVPKPPEEERVARARRRAVGAAARWRMGDDGPALELLGRSATPDARSYLIARLAPLGVEGRALVRRLTAQPDAGTRQALILALGEYSGDQLPGEMRAELIPTLLTWYADDPDPGVHGAVDWLLRHDHEGPAARKLDWGQADALRRTDAERRGKPPQGRRWFVNGQGITLTVIPKPAEFDMGSPATEPGRRTDEAARRRRLGRTVAVGTKPVTVEQFQRFLKDHPEVRHEFNHDYSPAPDGPILSATWYEAAQFCNWLSQQEGIPESQWCYPPLKEIKEGMKPLPDYLRRTGYRLPTEAEWECACRAGTATARGYGGGDDLLPRYAWFLKNSEDRTWPAGQKRPNDLGLFDMHGEVWNWVQDPAAPDPKRTGSEDEEDLSAVKDNLSRVLRGGSFDNRPRLVRSACRSDLRPFERDYTVGFRVARTVE